MQIKPSLLLLLHSCRGISLYTLVRFGFRRQQEPFFSLMPRAVNDVVSDANTTFLLLLMGMKGCSFPGM